MIIAIDGPSASGKSTVAKAIAERLQLVYLDTGAMYRAVAYMALLRDLDVEDEETMAALAAAVAIRFENHSDGQHVFVDDLDVTKQIRTPEVELAVSPVSAHPKVRAIMVDLQRKAAPPEGVVAEGRDIASVVFPQADAKIFLTAGAEERARRRAVQRHGGNLAHDASAPFDKEEEARILADLLRRDAYDSSRKTSPLKPAEDAVCIDSSQMEFDEVVRTIIELATAKASV